MAILEVRAHLDLPFEDLPDDYVIVSIDLGGLTKPIPTAEPSVRSLAGTRATGDAWLIDHSSPVLCVPSILAPRAKNYLINPLHPEAKAITIAQIEAFKFDPRLWNRM